MDGSIGSSFRFTDTQFPAADDMLVITAIKSSPSQIKSIKSLFTNINERLGGTFKVRFYTAAKLLSHSQWD